MKSFELFNKQENNFSDTIKSIAEQLTFNFKDTYENSIKERLLSIANELEHIPTAEPVFSITKQPDETIISYKDSGYTHILWYDYETTRPTVNKNVLAYHQEWKDAMNPEGIRIGKLNDDGTFRTSVDCSTPQYWMSIPEFKH